MRLVRSVLTGTPRSAAAIAAAAGCQAADARRALAMLVEARLALRVARGGYVRRGPPVPASSGAGVETAVGQRVLDCLAELSRPRDIARRIGRSPSCTTGHLCHLLRRGLVVRIGKGRYAAAAPAPMAAE